MWGDVLWPYLCEPWDLTSISFHEGIKTKLKFWGIRNASVKMWLLFLLTCLDFSPLNFGLPIPFYTVNSLVLLIDR